MTHGGLAPPTRQVNKQQLHLYEQRSPRPTNSKMQMIKMMQFISYVFNYMRRRLQPP